MNKGDQLLEPFDGAVFYENKDLYACVASYPIAPGHCIVAWKKPVKDIHLLTRKEYELIMDTVDKVRDALLAYYHTDKVYLLYLDEVDHVHWQLIPRLGKDTGFTLLEHHPKKCRDSELATHLGKVMKEIRL